MIFKCSLLIGLFALLGSPLQENPIGTTVLSSKIEVQELYSELDLNKRVSSEAFSLAVAGYEKITDRKRNILTLIDFSKPSTEERLFVIDMDKRELLFSSVVAHGKNSGGNWATHFSNRNGSHQSSLGFYLTQNTYQGKNGYSLVLEGLEKGVNDQARNRAIVIHGAAYANPSIIKSTGRLGRSFGCPALPQKLNRPIIDAIKGGSVLYIYAKDQSYLEQSQFI